jgi:SAM-dependent methyltransferase
MTDLGHPLVFDRTLLRHRRDRAASYFTAHSALFEEVGAQLEDRLAGIKEEFGTILCWGSQQGTSMPKRAASNAALVAAADLSEKMLREGCGFSVAADEEFLPFALGRFDLVLSNMNLHWVNDLPGAFVQAKNVLKPGGLFLAAMPGGATLHELRTALLEAELHVKGGAGPRLSPTIALADASALLQRAGFVLPVADLETVTLTYPDLFALMKDLRGMGESAVHYHRPRQALRRKTLEEADRIYRTRFAGRDGRLPATFEILFLHGRRPL